jgi:hypothetical protein
MIDISEILNDQDVCSDFQIIRTKGKFAAGGWQSDPSVTIQSFGAVRNTAGKELDMVPEADRTRELLTFRTVDQIFVTGEVNSEISDILLFQGASYRVLTANNYSEQGYWLAIATRMAGN